MKVFLTWTMFSFFSLAWGGNLIKIITKTADKSHAGMDSSGEVHLIIQNVAGDICIITELDNKDDNFERDEKDKFKVRNKEK